METAFDGVMTAVLPGAVQDADRSGYWGVPMPCSPPRRSRLAALRLPVLLPVPPVVPLVVLLAASMLAAADLHAQSGAGPLADPPPDSVAAPSDSGRAQRRPALPRPRPPHYWRSVAAGFATSLLAHEAAHVVTALAVGGRPTIGFDKGRPTVFSGIDAEKEPGKQFLFSSMGLNVQAVLDEAILDVPHRRGSPFERGVLAGGIATALFYVTLGRTASVSDVDYMARTSSLSKTDITLIYGGVAVMHLIRIRANEHYADFFARPMGAGEPGLRVGVDLR